MDDEEHVKQAFLQYDGDGDGFLTVAEVRQALRSLHVPFSEHVWQQFRDISGVRDRVSYNQFRSLVSLRCEQMRTAFDALAGGDTRGISAVSLERFSARLGIALSHAEVQHLLRKLHDSRTGFMTYAQFCTLYTEQTASGGGFSRAEGLFERWMRGSVTTSLSVPDEPEEEEVAPWMTLLAGAIAGMVSRTATAPLDRIKTLLQASAGLAAAAAPGAPAPAPAAAPAAAPAPVSAAAGTAAAPRPATTTFTVTGIDEGYRPPSAATTSSSGPHNRVQITRLPAAALVSPPLPLAAQMRPGVTPATAATGTARGSMFGGSASSVASATASAASAVSSSTSSSVSAAAALPRPPPPAGAATAAASGAASGAASVVSGPGTIPITSVRHAISAILKDGGVPAFWRGNAVNCVKVAPETAMRMLTYEQAKRLVAQDPDNITLLERFAAGATAGMTAQVAIYPLELLKTRIALSGRGQYHGLMHCWRSVIASEGPLALYRGLGASILGVIPYSSTELAVYSLLKDSFEEAYPDREPGLLTLLACGAAATTAGQLVSYPLQRVRTLLQSQGMPGRPVVYTGVGDCFRRIIASDGVRGLYRGLGPNFAKSIPAIAISYASYETAKSTLLYWNRTGWWWGAGTSGGAAAARD